MKELSSKVKILPQSSIRQMTILANKYQAINVAQGYPEFDPPKELLEALKVSTDTSSHQYSNSYGTIGFRRAIAKNKSELLKREIDPESEVLVTTGSSEAMASSILALCNEGDKIIIFSPFYSGYYSNAVLAGVEPIYVELRGENFEFDEGELEQAFKEDPKALILCNPSNPSGKVFSRNELEIIARLAKKYDTYVITDEVYEHIVFEPYEYTYFASLDGMFERTISCSSLSKSYSITGWRLGYIIADKRIIDDIRKIHDILTVCAATPLQEAAITAFNFDNEYYKELTKLYTEKRDFFVDGLDKLGIKHSNPQGTYFILIDITQFGFDSDSEFAKYLVSKYKVAVVPASSFYNDKVNNQVRLHFAKNKETLEEVLYKFKKLIEEENDYEK